MMEIRCSETNRMGQELPGGLKSEGCSDLAPARSWFLSQSSVGCRPQQANRQRSESGQVQLPERCVVRYGGNRLRLSLCRALFGVLQ